MSLGRTKNRSLLAWPTALSVAVVFAVSVSSCSKITSLLKGGAGTDSAQQQPPSAPGSTTSTATATTNPDGSTTVSTTQPDGTITTQTIPAGTPVPTTAQQTPSQPGTPGAATTPATGAVPPTAGTSTTAGTAATAPTATTPAAPATTTPTAQTAAAPAPAAKPLAPEKLCYKMTFHHKPSPGHSDRESCSAHKNFIKLTQEDVNLKSFCLRVDNVPVKYQVVKTKKTKKLIGLMIEPVAGPNSVITANFCTGKMTCKEDCKIPKDSFMDAIGGEDNNAKTENVQIVQWDPTEKGTDKDVSAQLEAELKKELAGTSGLKVFEDWVNDDQSLSCGTKSRAALPGVNPEALTTAARR
ncbi:hypothetical protein K2X30_07195 [bacterium]|jgi:hypothetical protein|nr:hypothetical protein [bacterium]